MPPLLGVIANGFKARRNASYSYAYDYSYMRGARQASGEDLKGRFSFSYGPSEIAWPVRCGTLPAEGLDLRPAVQRIAGFWSRVIEGA